MRNDRQVPARPHDSAALDVDGDASGIYAPASSSQAHDPLLHVDVRDELEHAADALGNAYQQARATGYRAGTAQLEELHRAEQHYRNARHRRHADLSCDRTSAAAGGRILDLDLDLDLDDVAPGRSA